MNDIKSRIEQIRSLETERQNLLLEIEKLKKRADAKARALESEISMLRNEAEELRLLLSGDGEAADSNSKKRK